MESEQQGTLSKKTRVYWEATHGSHLVAGSFGPASGVVYLSPIDSPGDFRPNGTYRFKYDWQALGPVGNATWNVFVGLYRLMRGTGGTASTWVLTQAPQATGVHLQPVGTNGTIYVEPVIAVNAFSPHFPEGIYAFGFLFVNTSTLPNLARLTLYGTTLPSFADWFYGSGSSGNTVLPATIATLGTLSGFKFYMEAA